MVAMSDIIRFLIKTVKRRPYIMLLVVCMCITSMVLYTTRSKEIEDGLTYVTSFPLPEATWFKKEPINKCKIFVVEEHHEVVPYWVQLVNTNQNNKAELVHIDAHSDCATPEWVPEMPINKVPQNAHHVISLMQSNDMFIVSSVIMQLIDSVSLVFPTWTADESYHPRQAAIGEIKPKNGKAEPEEEKPLVEFCFCLDNECHFNDTMDIPNTQCNQKWPIEYKELIHPDSYEYFKKKSVSSKLLSKPLILDIDEDYFGVELPSTMLVRKGMRLSEIVRMKSLVHGILCVTDVYTAERKADEWFQSLLAGVAKHCTPADSDACLDNRRDIWKDLLRHNPAIICDNQDIARQAFLALWEILVKCDQAQLKALGEIGVCMYNTPLSYDWLTNIPLCIGFNVPDNTSLVEEHVPNSNEAKEIDKHFRMTLEAMPKKPDVVTICRSTRDGYLHRPMQPRVEQYVLTTLKNTFGFTDEEICYSEHLAGGKNGWNKRPWRL